MSKTGLPGRILVIDDDRALCELLQEDLQHRGHQVWTALKAVQARELLSQHQIDIVLTDLNMPEINGIDFCAELHERRPDLPVIIMTAFGSLETAIAALRAGAYDFVTKPVDLDLLSISLDRGLQHRHLQETVRRLQDQVRRQQPDDDLLGESPLMVKLKQQIARIAGLDTSVLLAGESGTGKELVARSLHCQSQRCDGPLLPSTVQRCRRICWKVSSSDTSGALLPMPVRRARGCLLKLPAAPCYSTKLPNCPWRYNPSYCGSSKITGCARWVAVARSRAMSGLSPPATVIWERP
jgi:DNA-binding response OmpR family regulator